MQEKGIITTTQFIWLLFTIIASVTSAQVPALLIAHAGRDAWLACMGGWFLDVLLALIYAYMGVRFPGENFIQYSCTILGKYLGKIVGLMFPLFFMLSCVLLMRGLVQMIIGVFLPKTPFLVALVSGFLIVGYGARKGLEVIARVTELLGPLYIISLLIVASLVTPYVNLSWLKPQFDDGAVPLITGSFFILSYFGICIMMSMFIPLCNRPENGFLAKFCAVSMGSLFVGIIVIFSTAVLGYIQAQNVYAPGLELARIINISNFIQRIEVLWMMMVIAAGIVASSLLIWAFCLGISQWAGLATYKPLVYPATLVALMFCLAGFSSNMEQGKFIQYDFPVIGLIVEAGLEIPLFIIALLFNIRGKQA